MKMIYRPISARYEQPAQNLKISEALSNLYNLLNHHLNSFSQQDLNPKPSQFSFKTKSLFPSLQIDQKIAKQEHEN